MTSALRFAEYGFKYSIANVAALDKVTVDLPAGRIVAVIAPQGRGKTTLLRAAAGLLGEIYTGETTGRIEAVGPSAAFFDGYVQVTLAVETVREEIGLPLFASGLSRVERDVNVRAVCRELHIEALVERGVTELSGGEEKLVGIAASLVPDVPIHVLDEPFEQLDVTHFAAVVRAMKRRARAGRLVLFASGSLDVALNIADIALVGHEGVWSRFDRPTYEVIERAGALGTSPVMAFLARHHTTGNSVRRFRDAVRVAS
jgi:energy-coupling factor transporter ATP-binding protein EcfA2